jgi:2-polyprenyl-6-methoxyphenol hydroxylase-like FAD-dependent oxidoreductase
MLPNECAVIIVGGGPCGLMLANELGLRLIPTVLIEEDAVTSPDPRANATQARTMEHYRRHGFADEVRALGLPPDFPTDVAYFTRFAKHEIARFRLPSAEEAKNKVRKLLSGPWSAAELPHRVSQNLVVNVLHKQAQKYQSNSIHFNHKLLEFIDHGDHVSAIILDKKTGKQQTIRTDYLVGADGPTSNVRDALGISYEGNDGKSRQFMGGPMLAVLLRAPRFYELCEHPNAWMYVTFNSDRRAYMVAVNGIDEFDFHTQLHENEDPDAITDAQALEMFRAAMGVPIEAEVVTHWSWLAGRALVAEKMQKGRIFLAGDATHLFTPTGGMGYNTAIEDAVNLGWKLAAVIQRKAPESILLTYESERKPIAVRNTTYACNFADAVGLTIAPDELEEDNEAGQAARAEASKYFSVQARREFFIPGVTFGYRYDGSPIILSDGTQPPPDSANTYIPTACPGGRAPHFWLGPERSLYDTFGREWTLLRVGPDAPPAGKMARAASAAGIDLTIVDLPLPELLYLYEMPLVLIRPDQIVAWRGKSVEDAVSIIATVTGAALALAAVD